ncbi:MAG: UDP-2,3-diacylglucosamine diphosphatase [Verrucomicrobiales bacterium]|nr:UDP-2,3-diacylglucosamine diphosphatase [Verrucomicrobiales bacterium]
MKHRSVWISDVHLGTKHAQVDALLEFLREHESRYLYIVGDFIDGWELKRRWYWVDQYNVLLQKLLRKSRKNTRVTLVIGNHDEFLTDYLDLRFGSIRLAERAIHLTARRERFLVIHGHQFDGLVHFNRLLEKTGSALYQQILDLNLNLNRCRRMMGFGYWSLAGYLKGRAKSAVKFVTKFEDAMLQMARKNRVRGVICGHIHHPQIRPLNDLIYMNCGDWVENCTALVEDFDGRISLIKAHEDHVYGSGRGAGTPDPGDGDGPDAEPGGSPTDPGPGGQQLQPEFAGLL